MHEDFDSLSLREKANLVLMQGEHLVTTNFYGAAVKLYVHEGAYIEIYHHPVTRKIMRVSMATQEDLNKHLHGIRVAV